MSVDLVCNVALFILYVVRCELFTFNLEVCILAKRGNDYFARAGQTDN